MGVEVGVLEVVAGLVAAAMAAVGLAAAGSAVVEDWAAAV